MSPEELERREKIKKEEDEELRKAIALSMELVNKDEPKSVSVLPPKYAERFIASKLSEISDPIQLAEATFGISRKDMTEEEWKEATNNCTFFCVFSLLLF